ncbi:hypothetical protein BN8_03679 [Fibrisoma limi BUZ 3]|uniref:Uncharacterized protein n=1 Tax=Fibrisoma limi BUZ 3 TaxID=1185876 RepID=I2GKS7_9BACT|nr:hypothetical protein [Fibrisoma limi]CCH54503.1 hypothetical protein BN8_03679 [Fibrisoma limi BUZ 3]
MASERESVAYWLGRFPGQGYSTGQMLYMIDELEHDPPLPPGLSAAEVSARLNALYQLTGRKPKATPISNPVNPIKRPRTAKARR